MKKKLSVILVCALTCFLCISFAGCKKNTPKTLEAAQKKMQNAGYTVTADSSETLKGIDCRKGESFIHIELAGNLAQANAAFDLYKNWADLTSGCTVGIKNLWVYYGTADAIDVFLK